MIVASLAGKLGGPTGCEPPGGGPVQAGGAVQQAGGPVVQAGGPVVQAGGLAAQQVSAGGLFINPVTVGTPGVTPQLPAASPQPAGYAAQPVSAMAQPGAGYVLAGGGLPTTLPAVTAAAPATAAAAPAPAAIRSPYDIYGSDSGGSPLVMPQYGVAGGGPVTQPGYTSPYDIYGAGSVAGSPVYMPQYGVAGGGLATQPGYTSPYDIYGAASVAGSPVYLPQYGVAGAGLGTQPGYTSPYDIYGSASVAGSPIFLPQYPGFPAYATPQVVGGGAAAAPAVTGGDPGDTQAVQTALATLQGSSAGAAIVLQLNASGAKLQVLSDAQFDAYGHSDSNAFYDTANDSIYIRRSHLQQSPQLAAIELAHEATHMLDNRGGVANAFEAQARAGVAALGQNTPAAVESARQSEFELTMIMETRAFLITGQVARELGMQLNPASITAVAAQGGNDATTYQRVWNSLLQSSYNPQRRQAAARNF